MNEEKSIDEALAEAFRLADRLDAPLDARLAFYLSQSRALLPEVEAAYDALVSRLVANGAGSGVPPVGEKLPEFCLTDSDGHLVELGELLRNGPLVVSFNRGPWCDYCGLELQALASAYPAIQAEGAEIVSIVPERAEYAKVLQVARGLPFRVLTDLDLGYALSLGLVFFVGQTIKDMYGDFGIDLARFQGNGAWMLPVPATLVVGEDRAVKARFVDPDFRRRMAMEDILAALRS